MFIPVACDTVIVDGERNYIYMCRGIIGQDCIISVTGKPNQKVISSPAAISITYKRCILTLPHSDIEYRDVMIALITSVCKFNIVY